jgi:hypothetical protein
MSLSFLLIHLFTFAILYSDIGQEVNIAWEVSSQYRKEMHIIHNNKSLQIFTDNVLYDFEVTI